jgi:hypothetical protein
MRFQAVMSLAIALNLGACERGRTHNSGGGNALDDSPVEVRTTNLYRFVGVEKALADARKAVGEQRWGDAQAAAEALLKQQPGHIEAQKLAEQAAFEAKNFTAFQAFNKAVQDKNPAAAATSYHQIGAGSQYLEPARPDYEKLREQWTVAREGEARAFAARGKCRDAHRVARAADELFPEMRPRLDVASGTCKPADDSEAETTPTSITASVTPSAPEPPPAPLVAPQVIERPDAAPPPAPPKPAVAAAAAAPPPLPAPAKPAVAVTAQPPPAAPAPGAAKPKFVSPAELEGYRVAGDKHPSLPAGARMIAIRDHVNNIVFGVALCVSVTGEPTSVQLLKASEFNDANDKIVADVQAWRFHPYLVAGKPTPVCTRVVFVYQF